MRVCPFTVFPVSRFSYAVTGFSFVYALALQQSKVIDDYIFLRSKTYLLSDDKSDLNI